MFTAFWRCPLGPDAGWDAVEAVAVLSMSVYVVPVHVAGRMTYTPCGLSVASLRCQLSSNNQLSFYIQLSLLCTSHINGTMRNRVARLAVAAGCTAVLVEAYLQLASDPLTLVRIVQYFSRQSTWVPPADQAAMAELVGGPLAFTFDAFDFGVYLGNVSHC